PECVDAVGSWWRSLGGRYAMPSLARTSLRGPGGVTDACQAEVGSVGQCSGEPEDARAIVGKSGHDVAARVRIRDDAALAAKAQHLRHIHPVASGLSSLGPGRARKCRPPALWAT